MDGIKKIMIYIISALTCSILFWLFTGIYKDNEFGDKYWFIKHKPTWQYYFEAKGEWESFDELPLEEQKKMTIYHNYYKNRVFEIYIPL